MQRKFGMKRSFHCDDLSSVVGLDRHPRVQEQEDDAEALEASSPRKRVKRQRTISMDASSCPGVCYCCDGEAPTAKFMPSASAPCSDDHDHDDHHSPTLKASGSTVRLISPATSHVTVTPEATPAPSDGLNSLPCFPSMSKSHTESLDFPATAALEHFMLRQRCSPAPSLDDDDFFPSIEGPCDEQTFESSWPKFDQEDPPSPRNVEDFGRRVSLASRKSSSTSVQDSPNTALPMSLFDQAQKTMPTIEAPISFLSMASSFELQPTKAISQRSIPTVSQITEALARIET